MTARTLAATLLSVAALTAPASRADTLTLKNGDRLTGKVVHKAGDELAFDTPWAGTLKIRWSEVAKLETEGTLTWMTGEDDVAEGRLGGEAAPPLASIRYLNPTPDESGRGVAWSGHVNAGGASNSGNTTNASFHADADATGRARDWRVLAGGEFNEASDHDTTTASNWRARGEYNRFFAPRFFGYGRGTLEHDRFKALALRTTAGAGVGYQVFESPALNLSAQGGVDYVVVDNRDAPGDDYAALGWVVRYDQKPWGSPLQFFHVQDGTYSLAENGTIVLHTQTGLRAPVGGGINATLQYNYDWTNHPVPGRYSADRALLFTLGYAW